jgi:hypothetical protein
MVHRPSRARWHDVARLHIERRVSISDTSFFFEDDAVILDLPAGPYLISALIATEAGVEYVSAVRVYAEPARFRRGDACGAVNVVFGQIGICDRDVAEEALNRIANSEDWSMYSELLCTTELTTTITIPGGIPMAIVRLGSDGSVYDLVDPRQARRVGVEVAFEPEED